MSLGVSSTTLSGNNTYTGPTTVTSGTVVFSGNNVAATGGMTVYSQTGVATAQFQSPASINGTTRNVTVNVGNEIGSGGVVRFGPSFGAANITAGLSRIVASSTGIIAADGNATTSFDFNAAGLPNIVLGAVADVAYTGTLTPNGTTYRLGGSSGTLTMGNPLTGAGNSVVISGKVVLPIANSYGGGTSLQFHGTLTVGDAGALGTASLTSLGGTLNATGAVALTNPVVLTAGMLVTGADPLTLAGNISGPGGLALGDPIIGGGAVTVSGNNTFAGGITVWQGTKTLSGSFSGGGPITLNVGTIQLTGTVSNSTIITVHAGTVFTESASGKITGTTPFDIYGGTTTLSGANTYTGNTTIHSGLLKAGIASVTNVSGAFGNNSALILNPSNSITADITGFDTQIGLLVGGTLDSSFLSTFTLGAATLTIAGVNASPVSYDGVISGTGGSVIKTGAGTQIFAGQSTYTGLTTVNAGVLQFDKRASLYNNAPSSWTPATLSRAPLANLRDATSVCFNSNTLEVNSCASRPDMLGAKTSSSSRSVCSSKASRKSKKVSVPCINSA